MRIVLMGPGGNVRGYGTGFLVGDGVIITNNHVLPREDVAASAIAEAYYERDLYGRDREPVRFRLDTAKLWHTDKELDFSIVGIADIPFSGTTPLAALGWLPLIATTGKVTLGEWLSIVQHPKGERKQICVRENQFIKRDDDVLWYSTDTLAGSSGSPVFNNDWLLVALHHSGVPDKDASGRWLTVDGRPWVRGQDTEDAIKWIANEGIRISRIVEVLHTTPVLSEKPVVKAMANYTTDDLNAALPVLYRATQGPAATAATRPGPAPAPPAPKESAMATRRIDVTLEIEDDGRVSVVGGGAREADLLADSGAARFSKVKIDAPVVEAEDWIHGYDPHFLGASFSAVNLPKVTGKAPGNIAPLRRDKPVYGFAIPDEATAKAGVLNYDGYSVVMNEKRRLAYFSAANLDGGVAFPGLGRPTDRWKFDDRIDHEHQLGPNYYLNNKLDRGHLTRREDLEWGTDPVAATRRANGTCTWPNCSPQQELFNQDKHPTLVLWQALERYILEQSARVLKFRVQCFTGPVFTDHDPLYRGARIPLDFWKVVVAIAVDPDPKLFATAYVLSQRDVVDVGKLEESTLAEPFGKFELYQRPIAEIEAATGLHFTYGADKPLADCDPLAKELKKPAWQRRNRRAAPGATESFSDTVLGSDMPLESLEQILLA